MHNMRLLLFTLPSHPHHHHHRHPPPHQHPYCHSHSHCFAFAFGFAPGLGYHKGISRVISRVLCDFIPFSSLKEELLPLHFFTKVKLSPEEVKNIIWEAHCRFFFFHFLFHVHISMENGAISLFNSQV